MWFGTEADEKGDQARMGLGESNLKVAKPRQQLIDGLMVKRMALTPLIRGAGRCLKESHPKPRCAAQPLPESIATPRCGMKELAVKYMQKLKIIERGIRDTPRED